MNTIIKIQNIFIKLQQHKKSLKIKLNHEQQQFNKWNKQNTNLNTVKKTTNRWINIDLKINNKFILTCVLIGHIKLTRRYYGKNSYI